MGGRRRGRRARGTALLRAVTLLLLAGIVGDLAADGDCDPPPLTAGPSAVSFVPAVPDTSDEACTAFCVPDCFCCSRSVPAAPAVAPPRPVAVAAVAAPVKTEWPEGVRGIVDHPPRIRA